MATGGPWPYWDQLLSQLNSAHYSHQGDDSIFDLFDLWLDLFVLVKKATICWTAQSLRPWLSWVLWKLALQVPARHSIVWLYKEKAAAANDKFCLQQISSTTSIYDCEYVSNGHFLVDPELFISKRRWSLLQSQTMMTSIRGTTRLLRMLVAIPYVELLPVEKQEAPTLECLWNAD